VGKSRVGEQSDFVRLFDPDGNMIEVLLAHRRSEMEAAPGGIPRPVAARRGAPSAVDDKDAY
jgi:hypothetical protein